ncbi:secreted protein [Melampsora americana]|nr:secreted protein [Melampsora americana]
MNKRTSLIFLCLFACMYLILFIVCREKITHASLFYRHSEKSTLHVRSFEEVLRTFPKRDKITENLHLAPFWSKPLPPIESVAIISREYEGFIPHLTSCRTVQQGFTEVVNKFGPTSTRDELIKLQKIYIKIFYELEQILDLFEEKWSGNFVEKISNVSKGFSNSFQVLVSMGLNLKLDVNCILDFLHIKAFTTANIDILGIILLSRKVNSKLHQGQPLRF